MQMQLRLCLLFIFVIQATYGQKDSLEFCSSKCCLDDPTPAGVMISHAHKKGEWMFSYRYMIMDMKHILVNTSRVNADYVFDQYLMSPDHMRMDMHMIMAMYGLTDKITIMGMANYNRSKMTMTMLPGLGHDHGSGHNNSEPMEMKSSGIGDIKLNLIYDLLSSDHSDLILSPGISIPIGNISITGNAQNMYQNIRLPYNMQMGSGTWDFLPVINYFYNKNRLSYSSQLSSVIRLNRNYIGYKNGNELTLNNWAAYRWSNSFNSSLRIEASTLGAINGADPLLPKDYEPSSNNVNYGGQRVYIYAGTNYYLQASFLNKCRLGAEFGIPVYQNLNGPQMAQRFTLFASFSVTL